MIKNAYYPSWWTPAHAEIAAGMAKNIRWVGHVKYEPIDGKFVHDMFVGDAGTSLRVVSTLTVDECGAETSIEVSSRSDKHTFSRESRAKRKPKDIVEAKKQSGRFVLDVLDMLTNKAKKENK